MSISTLKPENSPPKPIYDNLEHLSNPFSLKQFDVPDQIQGAGYSIDYEYGWKFIYSYNGSNPTFNAYRREIERLLQWTWLIRRESILNLKRHDIEEFIRFCQKPPQAWIGTKNVSRFVSREGLRKTNKNWRPFVVSSTKVDRKHGISPNPKKYALSQPGIRALFSVLSSFFNFLIQEEITESNPVILIRQKSKFLQKRNTKTPVRRISNLQWEFVLETAEILADDNPRHERTLFIMNCLYGMYLRISELVADERSIPQMGDFRKDMDGNWWLHVVGKGNKSRIVTVSDEMLTSLKRFRRSLDLPALPTADESSPLVPKNLGNGPVTSTRQIRTIVQNCFDLAFQRMRDEGFDNDANELEAATVHWLRHTGISEDVKVRPREHVRDDAGHASMHTTDRYIDSDLKERHSSGRSKKMR
ncbi:integrase [Gammaproteobacteria bacterium 45_16_T64]|nr:integrase [Gammaproteobacteria bacterium 45_16_T64]